MKTYGFKVQDVTGGEYIRWFSSNGVFRYPMTQDLRKVSVELHGIDSFKKACRTAKALAEEYGFMYIELTEKDFRK
jgi:hypothetical protein